jgi:phenylacetate-CoA ligase
MLVTPDGTKVHGEYFSHLFYDRRSVLEFRVVQESLQEITVWLRLRPDAPALAPEEDEGLRRAFVGVFGPGVELEIRVVEQIPKTASGKHRFTESRVATGAP